VVKAARCYEDPGREIRAYAAKDQGIAGTCMAWQKGSRGAMKYSRTFVAIAACTISYCFSNAQEIKSKGKHRD
jgi:hypothetical protein